MEADMWLNVTASSKVQLASNTSRKCLRGDKELWDVMIALCNIGIAVLFSVCRSPMRRGTVLAVGVVKLCWVVWVCTAFINQLDAARGWLVCALFPFALHALDHCMWLLYTYIHDTHTHTQLTDSLTMLIAMPCISCGHFLRSLLWFPLHTTWGWQ